MQARLARWLLARKNPEEAAAGSSLPIDSEDRSSFRSAGAPASARIAFEAAAADSVARPASRTRRARSLRRGREGFFYSAHRSQLRSSQLGSSRLCCSPRRRPTHKSRLRARRCQAEKSFTHHTLRNCLSHAALSSFCAPERGPRTDNHFKTWQSNLDASVLSPPTSQSRSQLTPGNLDARIAIVRPADASELSPRCVLESQRAKSTSPPAALLHVRQLQLATHRRRAAS